MCPYRKCTQVHTPVTHLHSPFTFYTEPPMCVQPICWERTAKWGRGEEMREWQEYAMLLTVTVERALSLLIECNRILTNMQRNMNIKTLLCFMLHRCMLMLTHKGSTEYARSTCMKNLNRNICMFAIIVSVIFQGKNPLVQASSVLGFVVFCQINWQNENNR